jgi:hypothetical protein
MPTRAAWLLTAMNELARSLAEKRYAIFRLSSIKRIRCFHAASRCASPAVKAQIAPLRVLGCGNGSVAHARRSSQMNTTANASAYERGTLSGARAKDREPLQDLAGYRASPRVGVRVRGSGYDHSTRAGPDHKWQVQNFRQRTPEMINLALRCSAMFVCG